jgi:putative glutathione S-transferase
VATVEGVTLERFDTGRESSQSGEFVRQDSRFRDLVTADGSSGFAAAAGRYHLYVAKACPWAHRTLIVRKLKGLEEAIGVSHAHPFRDARGWAFPGGDHVDAVNGFAFLSEAYDRTDPSFDGRVSVPTLWDTVTGRVVNNESADIVRMLNSEFDAVAEHPEVDLYPEALRPEIDRINERVYAEVNNGVYRAGFAKSQEAYEEAFAKLFDALGWLEGLLGERRYLAGDVITEADWRLFTTLARFDAVYYVHFRCNGRLIADHPNLWAYARELYAVPGVAETVDLAEAKEHYYTTHDELNPKHIIPAGPFTDWTAPHGRDLAFA